jgi:hypothetical protein
MKTPGVKPLPRRTLNPEFVLAIKSHRLTQRQLSLLAGWPFRNGLTRFIGKPRPVTPKAEERIRRVAELIEWKGDLYVA